MQWKRSDLGLIPDYTEGEAIQKKAFELLLNLTEEHHLEQIVDQPTRGKNTLDLIFTNKPSLFGECSTRILKPVSDHNMVKFTMENPSNIKINLPKTTGKSRTEIAKFNFAEGDHQKLKDALTSTDWTGTNQLNPHDTTSKKIINNIIKAAKEANIPQYTDKPERRAERANNRTLTQINQLHKKMKHQHCTITDRERISANIEVLNKTMQEENEKDLRNKERTAIKKIKEEPKYFYKYANQNRKTRSRIGPLKS